VAGFEDEDSLPDVAFALEGQQLCDKRSRDDDDENEAPHEWRKNQGRRCGSALPK
jgi:hypothetical protein